MKSFVVILVILTSSFTAVPDPSTETICGVWKGYFGTETQVNSITIRINPLSKAEILYKQNDLSFKTTATYELIGHSTIIISYKIPGQQSSEVVLHGNLNRTSSFIDGNWDGEGNEGGCFYLQKQFQEANY